MNRGTDGRHDSQRALLADSARMIVEAESLPPAGERDADNLLTP
jgi:hypothetical protein